MYTNGTTTISGKKITVNGRVILNPTKEQLQEAGWREIVPPTPTEEELAQQEREARIWELKDALAQGDYKIIKCAEAQLMGEALPYDVSLLVLERNELRREINELEEQ
jgi:hypothetical protein